MNRSIDEASSYYVAQRYVEKKRVDNKLEAANFGTKLHFFSHIRWRFSLSQRRSQVLVNLS